MNRRALHLLTTKKCDAIDQPGRYSDGGYLALFVKQDQAGTELLKSWVLRYPSPTTGKRRDMGLGPYGQHHVTLAKARKKAAAARELLEEGLDPIEQRRRREATATFAECQRRYIAAHEAAWKNKKHAAQWVSTLDTYAASLAPLAVSAIDTNAVLRCLEPIWSTKTETATRVRQRIEAILDWATARKLRSGANPARWKGHLDKLLPKPTKLKKVQHRAALPYAEAPTFMAELRAKDSITAKALEFMILTTVRPGEACGARWDEIDGGLWVIPAERMKANKSHEVPLSDRALAILEDLPRVSEFVFPGARLTKPITTASGLKLLKEMRPGTGLTQHGFRSSFRDWAADRTGYPREVIEHALAHQLKDAAERAYHRGSALPKRKKLMQAWADFCSRPPPDQDNILPIKALS